MPRIVSTILFSKSHHLILFKREDPGTFRSPPAGTKGFTFRLITQPRSLILGVNDLLSDDVQGLLDAVHGDGLEDVLSDVPVLFHVDFLLGGLASLELLDDLFDKGSGERVALEVGVDVAGHDFLQARGAGVEGDEDDVAVNAVGDAGSVHVGHRAEGLVVVLEDDVELALIALAVGLHDLLAADVGEVAALGVEDGPAVLVGDLLEAVGTADGGGSAGGAFNDERVDLGDALGIGVGLQPLAGGEALILEVGANPGDILVGVVDGTVDNDDGDARVLALSQDGVPAGGDDRVNDYVVDFLLDEAADGLELGGGILVAVNEDQVVPFSVEKTSLQELVEAVRQSDSWPTWAKPTVMSSPSVASSPPSGASETSPPVVVSSAGGSEVVVSSLPQAASANTITSARISARSFFIPYLSNRYFSDGLPPGRCSCSEYKPLFFLCHKFVLMNLSFRPFLQYKFVEKCRRKNRQFFNVSSYAIKLSIFAYIPQYLN